METQTIIKENFLYNMLISLRDHMINDGFKIKQVNSGDVRVFSYVFTRTKNDLLETIKISYGYITKRIWIEIIN